jgi:DNA-binding transcriptional MerR regulator
MASTYSISDLAKEFDLTTRAMRFYEDLGLLQPTRTGPGGRNRTYTTRDRTRLRLTLRAKRLGLSLTEARDLIDMYDSPRDTVPQLEKFLLILAEHRSQLEAQQELAATAAAAAAACLASPAFAPSSPPENSAPSLLPRFSLLPCSGREGALGPCSSPGGAEKGGVGAGAPTEEEASWRVPVSAEGGGFLQQVCRQQRLQQSLQLQPT